MYCQKCGEVINDGSVFCSKCGASQGSQLDVNTTGNSIHCPKCGATGLQNSVEQELSMKTQAKGGYSGTSACLGWLLFGPLGLLCGNCGGKQKITTNVNNKNRSFWVCNHCGYKFRQIPDLEHEIYAEMPEAFRKNESSSFFLSIFMFIIGLVMLFTMNPFEQHGAVNLALPLGTVLMLLMPVIYFLSYSRRKKLHDKQVNEKIAELEKLKKEMGYED